MRARQLIALGLLVAAPRLAAAQTFPPDPEWVALRCGGGAMSDGYQDGPNANAERDIVGDATAPAGLRASDDGFFYLRLRLERTPLAASGALRPASWGIELDTDGVFSTYEVLVIVRKGSSDEIAIHRNTVTALPDDPLDVADEPAFASVPFSTHGRVVEAGSLWGGDQDYFLDLAVPWSILEDVGVTRSTPVVAWAASSSSPNTLNGDFACHVGSAGTPTLTGTAPAPTVLDPEVDTDRDRWPDADELAAGTDPRDPGSHPGGEPPLPRARYEGGGGCTAGGVAGGWGTLAGVALVAMALALRRRRASAPRSE